MQRKLAVLLGSTTLLFAGSSAFLLRELRAARAQLDEERRSRGELNERLAQLAEGRTHWTTTLNALHLPAAASALAPIPASTKPLAKTDAAAPSPGWKLSDIPFEQRKTMARARYGELFRELRLSDTDSDALVTMLCEQEERNPPGLEEFFWSAAPLDPEEAARNHRELRALLGEWKANHFEKLKKTLPARGQMRMVRDQLEAVGEPLSPEQQRDLLSLLSKAEPEAPRPAPTSPEELGESMRERNQRFRDQAELVLTPMQLKRLEEQDLLQKELQSRLSLASGPISSAPLSAAGSSAARR